MFDWLNRKRFTLFAAPLLAIGLAVPATFAQDEEATPAAGAEEQEPVKKDVPYVPTPEEVVEELLELAKTKKGEVLYDLGCGDGRIVVTAAKKYGVKGIGVDIDPERIKESNANAKEAGVTDRVKFIKKDLFTMDFKDADVMAMYLLTSVNEKLKPKLLEQMRPGARVVSHAFSMGDWEPDQEVTVDPGGQTVYFWIIPAKVEGSQTVMLKGKDGKAQEATLDLKQKYQMVTGTATIDGKESEITDGRLRGRELTFTADGKEHKVTIGRDKDDASLAEGKEGGEDNAQTAGEREKGEGEEGGGKSGQKEQQQDQAEQESGDGADAAGGDAGGKGEEK